MSTTLFNKTLRLYFPMLLALTLCILLTVFYWPVSDNIWQFSFDDGTYSHAYLVPFVALYILYDGKANLVMRQHVSIFLVPLLLVSVLLIYFYLAQYGLIVEILLPASLLCLLLCVFYYHSSLVVFSTLFLFIVPIWGALSPPLQQLSTIAVEALMNITAIPSYIEGNRVSIPSGSFEIANGCSGLRYFLTSLFFCLLFVYFYLKKTQHVVWFLLAALTGALIVNWLRIIIIIMVGHHTQMQSSLIHDHNNLGWLLYIPYLALVYWFGSKLSAKEQSTSCDPESIANHATTQALYWKPLLSALAITLLCSPLIIDQASNTASMKSDETSVINQLLNEPLNVYHYSDINNHRQNKDYFSQFIFNGYGLSAKASFFENTIVPDKVDILKQQQLQGFQVLHLQTGYAQRVVLAYRYHTPQGSSLSLSKLKKMRLKMALHGQRVSELWLAATPCNGDCAASTERLLKVLPLTSWLAVSMENQQ